MCGRKKQTLHHLDQAPDLGSALEIKAIHLLDLEEIFMNTIQQQIHGHKRRAFLVPEHLMQMGWLFQSERAVIWGWELTLCLLKQLIFGNTNLRVIPGVRAQLFPGGGRAGSYALGIGAKGYVGGGQDNSFANPPDLWEYTPVVDTWVQKTNYPGFSSPQYMRSFNLNNKGYFGAGMGNNFWQYDPATDLWTQKTGFPGTIRAYEVAFSIGDKGYTGTGWNGSTFNDFYEYDAEETFLWSNAAITNSVSITSTGSYSVIVTSALGCSATAVKAVTVNPVPVITSTASSPAICVGGTTSLSGGGASTYVWTGGVTNGSAFSPTTTLTYTVTGTAVTGCTNTAVNTITVNSLPTVSSTNK